MSEDVRLERPTACADEHLTFLDILRESGSINMFGARGLLMEMFPGLSRTEGRDVHIYWMKSFGERHNDVQL